MEDLPQPPAKARPLWIVLAIIGALAVVGSMIYSRAHRAPTLDRHISDVVSGPDGVTFDFATELPEPWDTMHVFPPYTDRATIERQLGFAWDGFADSRMISYDAWQLVVFVKDHEVVGKADVGRQLVAPLQPIPRAEAKFVVRGGELRLVAPK